MNQRSEEWLAAFGHLLPQDDETRALVLAGDIEICPACHGMSAYHWGLCDDQEGDRPAPGTVAHIAASSTWEWECGHCHRHWVDADSPLLHPCYTHADDC